MMMWLGMVGYVGYLRLTHANKSEKVLVAHTIPGMGRGKVGKDLLGD